jgi:hypothetical protein
MKESEMRLLHSEWLGGGDQRRRRPISLFLASIALFAALAAGGCATRTGGPSFKYCWDGTVVPLESECPVVKVPGADGAPGGEYSGHGFPCLRCPSADKSGENRRNAYVHTAHFPEALPNSTRDVISLRDKARTRLEYSIKTSDFDSPDTVTRDVAPGASRLLDAGEPLDVAFFCTFCSVEDNLQPGAAIFFDRARGGSRTIEFHFTPDARLRYAAAAPSGASADRHFITLVIYNRGVRYDQLVIPVDLVDDRAALKRVNIFQAESLAAREGEAKPSLMRINDALRPSAPFAQAEDARPDLRLTLVLPRTGEETLRMEATLYAPKAPAALQALQQELRGNGVTLGAQDLKLTHDTGLTTARLESLLQNFYESLSCLTVPTSAAAFRAELLARHGDRRCVNYAGTPERWSDTSESAARAANHLYTEGALLFSTLFGDPSTSELARFMVAARAVSVERLAQGTAKKPLKIRYHAGDFHIPIQLAHPPVAGFDRKNPQFFGLAFDIVAGKGAAGTSRQPHSAPLGMRSRWAVSFAGYRGQSDTEFNAQSNCDLIRDSVGLQSCQHFKALFGALRDADRLGGFPPPFFGSKPLVDDFLSPRGSDIDLIWTYAHGLTRFDEKEKRAVARAGSPRILLTPPTPSTPELTPERIDSLAFATFPSPAALADHPLVVLLACETGAAGTGGTSGQSFAQSFISAGARGVVTSEAEVNSVTANSFGTALINRLMSDAPPSEAVLLARRDVFARNNGNLWPLLFHYAGAHGRFREN